MSFFRRILPLKTEGPFLSIAANTYWGNYPPWICITFFLKKTSKLLIIIKSWCDDGQLPVFCIGQHRKVLCIPVFAATHHFFSLWITPVAQNEWKPLRCEQLTQRIWIFHSISHGMTCETFSSKNPGVLYMFPIISSSSSSINRMHTTKKVVLTRSAIASKTMGAGDRDKEGPRLSTFRQQQACPVNLTGYCFGRTMFITDFCWVG